MSDFMETKEEMGMIFCCAFNLTAHERLFRKQSVKTFRQRKERVYPAGVKRIRGNSRGPNRFNMELRVQ